MQRPDRGYQRFPVDDSSPDSAKKHLYLPPWNDADTCKPGRQRVRSSGLKAMIGIALRTKEAVE